MVHLGGQDLDPVVPVPAQLNFVGRFYQFSKFSIIPSTGLATGIQLYTGKTDGAHRSLRLLKSNYIEVMQSISIFPLVVDANRHF